MSGIAFWGAIELGLLFAPVAFAVYLSFRVLDFPDLTVDGSFPLGAAVSAAMIVAGIDPILATVTAVLSGVLAGMTTAWLHTRFGILHLLASILVMLSLWSINLRIMDGPNISLFHTDTIFTPLSDWPVDTIVARLLVFAGITAILFFGLWRFLHSQIGLAMRAVGINAAMANAQGIRRSTMIVLGVGLSNGLVALSGSLYAQSQGFADVTVGIGLIIVGLASVIGGEALLFPKNVWRSLFACLAGVLLYRLAVQFALAADFIGIKAQDLNLITAVLIVCAIVLPRARMAHAK